MRRLVVLLMGGFAAHAFAQREAVLEKRDDRQVSITNNVLDVREFTPPDPKVDWKSTGEFQIQKTRERVMPSGKKILIHLGQPPMHPPDPLKPEPVELTDAELEKLKAEYIPEKFLSLSATVVDEQATLVRWSHAGKSYKIWSAVDFNHLRGLSRFHVDGQPYSLFMGIGNASSEHRNGWEWLGESDGPPDFDGSKVEYEFINEDVPDGEALEVIHALHEVYASKGPELKAAYGKRERENAKRRAWLEQNPPAEKDAELYLWQGKDGGLLIDDDPSAAPKVSRPSKQRLQALTDAYVRGMREKARQQKEDQGQ
ncbi:MAG: hypothetical protein GWQ08_20145 [Verrucomicrobiaceae bacterium]|nr:hypothetical protein [Verrucomicrobiaceae bacterium]